MKSHYFILYYYFYYRPMDYLLELFMSTSSTTASVCQILMLGQCISGSKITLSTVNYTYKDLLGIFSLEL